MAPKCAPRAIAILAGVPRAVASVPGFRPLVARNFCAMTAAALGMPSRCSIRWVHRFNLSQVGELIAIQWAVASTIISGMDGDFYTTLRWRLLRGFMLWFYGRRCMRCGSTYRVEVDHIYRAGSG
jgi:hypothetical protein